MTFNHLIYLASRHLHGFRVFRYLSRHHPRILMYHRITPSPDRFPGLDVKIFRQQMEFVASQFNVVPLSDLVAWSQNGQPIPENTVVLTFDDGYYDFYEHAFPVLKALGLPCNLYVVTDFIDGIRWLWPDLIRESLRKLAENGEREIEFDCLHLPLESRGVQYCWNAAADFCLATEDSLKWQLLGDLAKKAGLNGIGPAPEPYANLSWDQLREMADFGVSVGSHSCSHPILTHVTEEQLQRELELSKSRIETELQKEVDGFCYPNGKPSDFNEKIKEHIKAAGYYHATTAYPSRDPLADRYQIGRYSVAGGGAAFEKALSGFTYLGLKGEGKVRRPDEGAAHYR